MIEHFWFFRDKLHAGIPSKKEVDHAIEIDNNHTFLHRPVSQLPPAELAATKDYDNDLLKKRSAPNSVPFEAPIYFVKKRKNYKDSKTAEL